MSSIIVDGKIVEDQWTHLAEATVSDIVAGSIIPLAVWQEARERIEIDVGVWLASDEAVEEIAADLDRIALVALHFPVFSDGRHYSSAQILRRRYHYQGEIRAFGDVRRDQLEQMHRCGFNAYVPRAEDSAENILKGLALFSYSYQGSADRDPLFRTRS